MRKPAVLLATLAATVLAAAPAHASVFDRTFGGGDGIATLADPSATPAGFVAQAVAVQPNGKIVVGGRVHSGTSTDLLLARFNRNGTLDTSFGPANTGTVVADVGHGESIAPKSLRIAPGGKIVAAGQGLATDTATKYDVIVARWSSDGVPDGSFSDDGYARVPQGGRSVGIALQPEGKVVVGYGTSSEETGQDFGIVRLNDSGGVDDEFGTKEGATVVDFAGDSDFAEAMVQQPDGKLVLVGDVDTAPQDDASNLDFGVVRVNADGTPDSGAAPDADESDEFGTGGKTTVAFDLGERTADVPLGVVVQPDGKLVLAGVAVKPSSVGDTGDFAFVRLRPDGSLDNAEPGDFSGDGKATVDIDAYEEAQDVVVQPDGKLLAAGTASHPGSADNIGLVRLTAGGAPDPSFDGDGRLARSTAGGAASEEVFDLTLSGEKVLAAGEVNTAPARILLLSLLHSDPDDDGVGNPADNCPGVPNPGQANVDADARGNACDPSIDGRAGNDTLIGTALGEVLNGHGGADTIRALGGPDTLNGGLGGDTLNGGLGADKLNGGPGPDKLRGGKGKDAFAGGPGNDVVTAADGKRETVRCGKGKGDRATVDEQDQTKGCEDVTRK